MLVTFLRLQKGMSPFLGSRDHYALRLEKYGFYREEILLLSYACSIFLSFAAYEVTLVVFERAMIIYAVIASGRLHRSYSRPPGWPVSGSTNP